MADEEHLLLALEDTSRTGARVAGLRVLAAFVGFAATIVIARALGPIGRGLYALPLAFLGIAMALSHVGLEGSNLFLASRGVPLRRLWATSTGASLLVSAAAWAVVVGASVLVGRGFVGGLPASWVAITLTQLPILLMTLYWTSVLQLDGALAPTTVVTVVGMMANAAMVMVLGLAGALTPFRVLALTWVTVGVTWALVLRLGIRRGIASLATDRTLLARAIAFGLRAQLATVFVFLLLRVDQVLVQRILGFRELGLYALTVVIAELLWLLTDPFAASLLPHQVRAASGDERRLGYATARLGLALAAILCVIVWIVAPYAIRLAYGEAFVDATWPVRWLLPGVAAIAAQRPLYAIVTKEGRMGLAAAMNAAALAVNLALNLLLLPSVGVVGAAIASTVTYLILGFGYVLATRRPGIVGWSDLLPRHDDLLLLVRGVRPSARSAEQPPQGQPESPRSPRQAHTASDRLEQTGRVDRCPLCGGTDGSRVAAVPYAVIWNGLREEWHADLSSDVMRRHEPGSLAVLVRCAECGLEYFAGAIPGDSEFYECLMGNTPYHADRWEFGIVLPRIPRGAAVVDLGCGEGAFLRRAAERAGRVVGVDHNADAIRALVEAGLEGSTETFESFAQREPGAFDVAFSFHTLEHLPDARTAICAARALLRPGGLFFVSVPNRSRFGRRDDEALDCPPHHVSRWSAEQFHEIAERFDLDLVSVHIEDPDLSHARVAAAERSRLLERLRLKDGRLLTRLWMKAAIGPRRHERAIGGGEYRHRGVLGHAMLAELRVPAA